MRVVVQRVINASCEIDNKIYSSINKGFLIYLGITDTDTNLIAEKMAVKISKLRIFSDENDKLNLDLNKVGGEILVISQFTLYAETKDGNRPSFVKASKGENAVNLYNKFIDKLKQLNFMPKTGVFGADMKIHSINDGPCTILIEM